MFDEEVLQYKRNLKAKGGLLASSVPVLIIISSYFFTRAMSEFRFCKQLKNYLYQVLESRVVF